MKYEVEYINGYPYYTYYSKDGNEYPTEESAKAADEAWDAAHATSSSESSGATSELTEEFLSQWAEISTASLEALNEIIANMGEGSEALQETLTGIQEQAAAYEEQYGSLEQEAIETAMADLQDKRSLVEQMMGYAQEDIEGVTGRAVTDITGAAESARAQQQREMQSYGIDPSSLKYGALTEKSYMDEARDKVIAMNVAAREEKERAAEATSEAYGMIDPTEAAGIATDIAAGSQAYAGLESEAAQAVAEYDIEEAKTQADVVEQITDIGEQYGSAGLTLYGIEMGSGSNSSGSSTSTTNSSGGSSSYIGETINLGRDPETGEYGVLTT